VLCLCVNIFNISKVCHVLLLGKRPDGTDEDLKGQISKGVANYVSDYFGFN